MVRNEFIRELAYRMNINKEVAAEFVNTYEQIVYDVVNSGEDIIFSNFIRFKVSLLKGRVMHDANLNAHVYRQPKYRLRIKALGDLKKSIEEQPVAKVDMERYGRKDDASG